LLFHSALLPGFRDVKITLLRVLLITFDFKNMSRAQLQVVLNLKMRGAALLLVEA
jgi:hypothetical protein